MVYSYDSFRLGCLGTCLFLITGCFAETKTADTFSDTALANEPRENAAPLVGTSTRERPKASEKGPWPRATTESTDFNFGDMSVGEELSHVFRIGNAGDADLVLQPGKPTCKCTEFEVHPLIVKPGGFADVNVTWNAKERDANFDHGGPVFTNDPERPEIRYSVKGVVDSDIVVLPDGLWNVGEITEDRPGEMIGVLMSRIHDSFKITKLECDSRFVKAAVEPVSEKELGILNALCAFKVKVTIDSSMPLGTLDEDLVMTVDCAKSPVVVKISARKTGPIRILPLPGVLWSESTNHLRLGKFSSQNGHSAELMLIVEEPEGQTPLQFTSVDSTPSFLNAELERLGRVGKSKARYKMKITIPAGSATSERTSKDPGVIDIKTNHPLGQHLRLKVTYELNQG